MENNNASTGKPMQPVKYRGPRLRSHAHIARLLGHRVHWLLADQTIKPATRERLIIDALRALDGIIANRVTEQAVKRVRADLDAALAAKARGGVQQPRHEARAALPAQEGDPEDETPPRRQ